MRSAEEEVFTLSLSLSLSLIFPLLAFTPSALAEESITITTYYPSPYGVYKNLRLYPNDDSTPGAVCPNPGEMYYSNTNQALYICSGSPSSTWIPAPGVLGGASIPSKAVMFFNLASCPSGWTELVAARGRYIVGLPAGGTLAGTDGTALTNLEDRPVGRHNHGITDPGHYHEYGAYGVPWYYSQQAVPTTAGSGMKSTTNTTGITINNTGSVAGTNAPYIQLLTCQKN